ncbi:hypothetical protein [Sulfuricaulis limicola]|uniref:hypothetical protein n=1 Tax=Sulfuricaulis limicola TaxID=1620215 RepID=UPI0011E4CB65|nr:hypothetical protein [Sulfuricaulis limicola]
MAEYYRMPLPLPVVIPEKLLRGAFCDTAFNTASSRCRTITEGWNLSVYWSNKNGAFGPIFI